MEEPDGRLERDYTGELRVPANVFYGVQTQRAVENFRVSECRFQRNFIQSIGLIKACAAKANGELGALPADLAFRIAEIADRIASGLHFDDFVVDVFQSGSGTSTNMNANEIIARISGAHPNDDVNCSQSSNDVIPPAIHIAAVLAIRDELLPGMELLRSRLEGKSHEFWDVIKIGRTHLQDATPMMMGEEFGGYAHQLMASAERVKLAMEGIYEIPLGGTAIGTGVNMPIGFAARAIALIAERTEMPFREARNHFEAQAAKDAVLFFLSGALKAYAVALTKAANDIRWMGSGPRCGLGEIRLKALQPGSSIMPGRVNPVIAASVLMVCAQIIGDDAAITWGCAAGNFELNAMMPLIAHNLLDSISLLATSSASFGNLCIGTISANSQRTSEMVEQSLAMATFLTPEIRYDRAAAIAKEAYHSGRTVRDVAIELSGLSVRKIEQLFAAGNTQPSCLR